jgi:hypothetical protein
VNRQTICDSERENLEQEKTADYRQYVIAGSPERLGQALASHHPGIERPRREELTPEQITFSHACAREARLVHPPLVEELEAWADALSVPLDEAYFYLSVGMTETSRQGRSRAPSTMVAAQENRQCSTVGLMTRQGPVVGRNFDLFYRVRVRHRITTKPETGFAHVGMYDGLVSGRTDGLNEQGLFVSLHTVRSKPPERRKPGLFCVHIARIVLETCSTAEEAAARIALLPHLASYNYFLADPDGMLVVEAHPERVRMRAADRDILACTNHYMHPDTVALMRAVPPKSRARQGFLTEGARRLLDELDAGDISTSHDPKRPGEKSLPEASTASAVSGVASLMRDHTVPVCGHADGMATLWSSVAVPRLRWVAFSRGAPCRNSYIETRITQT